MPKESKEYFAQKREPEEEEKLSPEKLEIQGRLQTLIRTISGKSGLEVTTKVDTRTLMSMAVEGKDANQEWYRMTQHDPKTKKVIKEFVHIPDQIFETNENVAKGKAAHEAGHVAITRMGEFIPDEVMQELGFHAVISAMEERPTDQVVRERYPGAGTWVDEARQDNVKRALELLKTKGKEKLGYVPKFAQLADLLVHAQHYPEASPLHDPEVVKLYNEKIRGHAEHVEKTLPPEGAKEAEVIGKAKERYKITYSKIWPEAKKLVEKDVNQESLKQMMAEQGENLLKQLSEALQEELKNVLERAFQEIAKEKEKERKTGAPPIPMDELSEDLKKALKESFDNLSEDQQEALKEKAQKALAEVEDDLVEEFSGKLESEPTETHTEYERRKTEEQKQEEQKEREKVEKKLEEERIASELKEVERRQAGIREKATVYDQIYQQVRELDNILYRRLEEVFTPSIKKEVKLKTTGARLNLPAVYKWEAARKAGAKTVEGRIFETVQIPDKKDYVFTLLVDLSGSMRDGGKIQETFKGTVLLSEVLNRLGVKFEVLGFQDEAINFKDFDEDLSDKIRRKMSGMIDEVYSRNPGGHNVSGYNDDGPCLLEASRGLDARPEKEKFLVVLSDGLPAGLRSTAEDLTMAVEKILKTTDQKLVGIGLGPDTEHVKEFYPTSLPDTDVKNLAETLGALLEDIILSPGKYSFAK